MKIRIYGLMALLFFLGMICGVLLTVGFAKRQIENISATSIADLSPRVVKLLDHRLKLSDQQTNEITKVLREGEKEVLPLRKEFRSRTLSIIQTYQPKIAIHLETDQQKELDKMVTRLLDTWKLDEELDSNNEN